MRTLNIIGCGRVGKTLARLFSRAGVFEVQDLLSRTQDSAHAAADFAGSGRVANSIDDLRAAEVWMITPPDQQIEASAGALASAGRLAAGNVAFHCSGALSSGALSALRGRGVLTASVHPLKTFADPARAVETFRGTPCAVEGDAAALAVLKPAFEKIGAAVFAIDPARKTEYHAACVLASNDLVALVEAALRACALAGLAREDALRMLEPIVRETADNVFALGPAAALTGPVARGDAAVVARHRAALAGEPRLAGVYRELARVALDLAHERGRAPAGALEAVARALDGPA